MEIKKTGKIEYKVFKERDLQNLINYLITLKEEINNEHTELVIEVRYEDGTTNSGYDLSVLDETKLIKSVSMSLRNFRLNQKINIDINFLINEYSVSSKDKDWVNAKFVNIKEIIDATPKQNVWFSKFSSQILLTNIFGLSLGWLIFQSFFVKMFNISDKSTTALALVVFLSIFVGQLISFLLFTKLLFKLYPEIEFDTTLDHLNKHKKIKNMILVFTTLVLLPIALNILSNLIF